MDLSEAKQFFAFILDLDYHKKKDQQTFMRIMRIVDPENSRFVNKGDVLDFFSIPGFLDLARVEHFNAENERKLEEEIDESSRNQSSIWSRKMTL